MAGKAGEDGGTGRTADSGKQMPRPIHVTLGKDAAYYHPDAVHVLWCSDQQPWGYVGVRKLVEAIEEAVEEAVGRTGL